MFKSIQNIIHQNSGQALKGGNTELLPLRTADQLLQLSKRKIIIDKTLPLLSLSKENTNQLAVKLLRRFVEYAQELPETRHHFYAKPGGFIEHALERTQVAMKLCRQYFLPSGTEDATLTQPQTLWAYALFSASLLHDVGRLIVDLTVKVSKNKKGDGKVWLPFAGNMLGQGTYYQYNFNENYPEDFRRYATTLLAKEIMPQEGFSWIASNRQVFLVWLALLQDDTNNSGAFGAVLERADAQAMITYYREIGIPLDLIDLEKIEKEGDALISGRSSYKDHSRISQEADIRDIAEKGAGIAFINWLRSEMASNKLMINQPPLFGVPGGFLIGPDIIKLFTQFSDTFKNAAAIEKSLGNLGVTNGENQKFLNIKDNSKISGVVVNSNVILDKLPQAHSQKFNTASSNYVNITEKATDTKQFISGNGKLLGNKQAQQLQQSLIQPNPKAPFS